jgi:hypothetical protein
MALIKCPNCGKTVSDRAMFCPNCKMPILGEEPVSQYQSSNQTDYDNAVHLNSMANESRSGNTYQMESSPFPSNNGEEVGEHKNVIIGIICVFLIVIISACVWFFKGYIDRKEKAEAHKEYVQKEIARAKAEAAKPVNKFIKAIQSGENIAFTANAGVDDTFGNQNWAFMFFPQTETKGVGSSALFCHDYRSYYVDWTTVIFSYEIDKSDGSISIFGTSSARSDCTPMYSNLFFKIYEDGNTLCIKGNFNKSGLVTFKMEHVNFNIEAHHYL